MTEERYEAWKDSLPVEHQIDADLYAHVGHTPLDFVPNRCTACALNQSFYQALTGQGILWVCGHGTLVQNEECEHGCR